MADIFQNAHVTICAMPSDSCQKGFLKDRSVWKFPVKFNSRLNPAITGTYWLVDVDRQPFTAPYSYYDKGGSEWSRRGWVFQEAELSTRLLQFGAHMLHFECSECLVSANDHVQCLRTSIFRITETVRPIARRGKFIWILPMLRTVGLTGLVYGDQERFCRNKAYGCCFYQALSSEEHIPMRAIPKWLSLEKRALGLKHS